MIKTRIFQFVGHIHNMQLCIEIISFINHENESPLRWFYSLCEPRNFSRILCPVAGCIQAGWGSDLCLPAVVLWNSAPHVSTMLGSNLDLSDLVLDILHRARGLREFSLSFLTLRHLLLFLGITQQSTSRRIRWHQRDRVTIIQRLALVPGRLVREGKLPL